MSFPLSAPPSPLTYFGRNRFDQILPQFFQAIAKAIHTSHPKCNQIQGLLNHICNSGIQTKQLTEMVYELCSTACNSNQPYREVIVLVCLEIGFHHLNYEPVSIKVKLIHTEHHQKLARTVVGAGDGEVIADLLYAWSSRSDSHQPHPVTTR